jgi:hypothetical protein
MYINPILVGVLSTILAELMLLFVIALAAHYRGKHK